MKRNKLGQFLKGSNLGNQCAKGNKPNKTSIKKGQHLSLKTELKNGHTKTPIGKNNWNWKGGKGYCMDCNKKLSRRGLKRCQKCGDKFKSGENHPNWQGGKSFEPYTLDWTRTLKISIRERDNYTCKLCGEKQCDEAYCVHHIDYDKKNCNPENLITLCRSCHTKTNQNREYWINYFKNL